jgi:hypothetical protein
MLHGLNDFIDFFSPISYHIKIVFFLMRMLFLILYERRNKRGFKGKGKSSPISSRRISYEGFPWWHHLCRKIKELKK